MGTGIQTATRIILQVETATGITLPTETEAGISLGPTIMAGNHAVWNLMIVMEIRRRIQTLVLLSRSTKSKYVDRM